MQHWGNYRYYALNYYLKQTYQENMYKLALNGGMTCPNRDGKIDVRGCIFCSEGGSGDFAGQVELSISEQLQSGKEQIAAKVTAHSYIAYFQAFTNTYAEPAYLEKIYEEAIADPTVKILSIATRPDCLSLEVLDLLSRINQKKPVWVELGFQTASDDCAQAIRRGYTRTVFEDALRALRARNLTVIVHTIIGLPFEARTGILETITYLNQFDIQGIKLQLLHILKYTDLGALYEEQPFWLPSLEEYLEILADCITHLRPDIVVHRLTGDGPKDLLIAPLWTGHKRHVLNSMNKYFKEQDIWQGKDYEPYKDTPTDIL